MLRRIDIIQDCGLFQSFRWDSSVNDFARINLIFGSNGSGKTSLARAFSETRNPDGSVGNVGGLAVTVEESGVRRSTGGQDDPVFDRLLVFSEDFVDRSHRFKGPTPNMPAVLTLGQRTADAEVELERLRENRAVLVAGLADAKKNVRKHSTDRDSAYERVSKAVVGDLTQAGGKYQSRGNYSVAVVKTAFAGSHERWATLSDQEFSAKKILITGGRRDALTSGSFSVTVAQGLIDRASQLLGTTPVTIVLDTLEKHPEASSWVQAGRPLHAQLSQCIFCGSELTEERKHDIEQHFSTAVTVLQQNLINLIENLDGLDTEVAAVLARVPKRGELFEDLQARYDEAEPDVRSQAKKLKTWIAELLTRAKSKLSNVLASVDATVGPAPQLDGSELEAIRDEQEKRVKEHALLVAEAAQAIEWHHLKAEETAVADLTKELKQAEANRDVLTADLQATDDSIASLESVEGDPLPSAVVLTQEVSRLLGRSELRFEAVDGRYHVTRDGEPAVGLSMGERTAITLVHFMECVARFDTDHGRPIVVIDDPVSSLDGDIFMGISTYVWSEAVAKDHVDQLFLMTHNFELFRQWDIQIASLHKNRELLRKHPAAIYELRARFATINGRTRRRPHLVNWPPSPAARNKVRSAYHHAFLTVGDAKRALLADGSLERQLDAQLLFPNVIRRMLETFLAFKRPDWVGDFNTAMSNSAQLLTDGGYEGDPGPLRLRLTRYAHAYSHAESPETDQIVRPEEVGPAITAVFTFMNAIDEAHFRGLCTVVGLDPEELLQDPPPAT